MTVGKRMRKQTSFILEPGKSPKRIQFPFDGLCFVSFQNVSGLFRYQLQNQATDAYYSDRQVLSRTPKQLLPFSGHEGRSVRIDYETKNNVLVDVRFQKEQSELDERARLYECTLPGLRAADEIEIRGGVPLEIPLTNYLSAHYEIHEVYSTLDIELVCDIRYRDYTMKRFNLFDYHCFDKRWLMKWPQNAILTLQSKQAGIINPERIMFAGYLKSPDDVLERTAPSNAWNSFMLEGIRVK